MDKGFLDDMNDWSKENFDLIARTFKQVVKNNREELCSPVIETAKRDKVIGKDDLTDLQILLGQINTVDDLIKNM